MILNGLTNTGNENKSYAADPRIKSFLDMIALAEGTAGKGNNGYNVIFGGSTFSDYSKHPNKAIPFGNTSSTAAGRYQFLYRTYTALASKTGTADFSPASQDINAVQLLRDNGAINYILSGDIKTAISKVKKIWASFPGAGYGQGERSLSQLIAWYNAALQSYGGKPSSKINNTSGSGFNTAGIDTNKLLIVLAAAAGLTIFVNLINQYR